MAYKKALKEREFLIINGARQNNLKGFDLAIPHNALTLITGLSGSGKSSLAFDTIYSEGRWRYMESLSSYTRLFMEKIDRPLVDSIHNVRPAIALEQRNPIKTSRSTVGTLTEIYDYLCLLFGKIGRTFCPDCNVEVREEAPQDIVDEILKREGERIYITFPLILKGERSEVLKDLMKRGFIRLKVGDEVLEVADVLGREASLPEEVRVVVDRLVVKREERARLADSVETAFREGGGEVIVEIVDGETLHFRRGFTCNRCGRAFKRPTPLLFSFNHPVSACPECKGFGNVLLYDEDRIVPNKNLSLEEGAIEPWTKPAYEWWYEELESIAPKARIDLRKPYKDLTEREKEIIFRGYGYFGGIDGFFQELEEKRYKLHIRVFLSRYKGQFECPRCRGARLVEEALWVRIGGRNIFELSRMSIKELRRFFDTLTLTPMEREIAKEALRQVRSKLEFLYRVGLDYLTLDRQSRTLSGGEVQRVRLAGQLGNRMVGTLYVLDEPSIGLHARDTRRLIDLVKELVSIGNTVIVVEHDESFIRSADYMVEMGPLSGKDGGHVVYAGDFNTFLATSRTITARYLRGEERIPVPRWRRKGSGRSLRLKGARENNLKSIDVKIPLHTFTCITGVSGSGKSSLVTDTLYNALARAFALPFEKVPLLDGIEGLEHIKGVKLIDQSPIGKTPRSNPITYIGGFGEIRRFFASLPQARRAGLTPAHFSFNLPKGRCDKCNGDGRILVEMYFLADVYVTCDACKGKRFKPHILEVKYQERSISDVLDMTVKEAVQFFPNLWELQRRLSLLVDVGLDYLPLGQPAITLSGGEAQRLKIAKELGVKWGGDFVYIMDEPTTGLHTHDVKRLLSVINRLVDEGNTVIVVEHNLDVIKSADYIIDLGPEGGDEGGMVVAKGTPEEVAKVDRSHTGRFLREVLKG